jgi:hypothetical protein
VLGESVKPAFRRELERETGRKRHHGWNPPGFPGVAARSPIAVEPRMMARVRRSGSAATCAATLVLAISVGGILPRLLRVVEGNASAPVSATVGPRPVPAAPRP